jgi:hypothetical protein
MDNLRIGAEILREAVNLGSEKEERAARSKKEEKAAADAVAEKVSVWRVNPLTFADSFKDTTCF